MVVRLQEGDRRGGELITVEDRFDTERVMIKASDTRRYSFRLAKRNKSTETEANPQVQVTRPKDPPRRSTRHAKSKV